MPLPLPNLDDRSYRDLLDYARSVIPTYDYEWTDHNPSDPGITLIELFAWLAEMLVYRANQVPRRHQVVFLRLLNGPSWDPPAPAAGQTLDDVIDVEIREAIIGLRTLQQAVTKPDYDELASANPTVARALAVGLRNLDAGSEDERTLARSGHVSVVAVPRDPALLQPQLDAAALVKLAEFLADLARDLDEVRMLTTRLHVVAPSRAPVAIRLLVARRPDFRHADLERLVLPALRDFFDPLLGGEGGTGWPFGRSVYVSEIVQLLERLDAVDYVPHAELSSTCVPEISLCVEARQDWNDDGELVRLVLEPHHLPLLRVQQHADGAVDSPDVTIVSAAAFVAVTVVVHASAAATLGRAAPLRAVKSAVRALLEPPGLDAAFPPTPAGRRTIASDVFAATLTARLAPEGIAVDSVTLAGDRVVADELEGRTMFAVEPEELLDVTPRVELEEVE